MASPTLLHLTLLLLLFFSLPSLTPAQDDDKTTGAPLIRSVCRDTKYYKLCVDALSSDHRSFKVYFKDLGLITVDIVADRLKKSAIRIHSLFDDSHDPVLCMSLKRCQRFYDVSFRSLRSTSHYLKSKEFQDTYDYQPAVGAMWNVKKNLTACGKTFMDNKVLRSPIQIEHHLAVRLADISLDILGDLMV